MAKYRSKPTTIEAEQWFPGKEVPGAVLYQPPDLMLSDRVGGRVVIPQEPYYEAHTAHGDHIRLEPGDWVIAEPNHPGRYYPCKPDVFEERWEPA